jgi:hypothetical protein
MSFRMSLSCGDSVEIKTLVYICSRSGFLDAERICHIVPRRGEGIPESKALCRSSGDVAAKVCGDATSLFHKSEISQTNKVEIHPNQFRLPPLHLAGIPFVFSETISVVLLSQLHILPELFRRLL